MAYFIQAIINDGWVLEWVRIPDGCEFRSTLFTFRKDKKEFSIMPVRHVDVWLIEVARSDKDLGIYQIFEDDPNEIDGLLKYVNQ